MTAKQVVKVMEGMRKACVGMFRPKLTDVFARFTRKNFFAYNGNAHWYPEHEDTLVKCWQLGFFDEPIYDHEEKDECLSGQAPQNEPMARELCEVCCPRSRLLAIEAMLQLWDAMDLSRNWGGIRLAGGPDPETMDAYYKAYRELGELILGDDCPEREKSC